jgi:uncharacterized protein YdeI (BOF family)
MRIWAIGFSDLFYKEEKLLKNAVSPLYICPKILYNQIYNLTRRKDSDMRRSKSVLALLLAIIMLVGTLTSCDLIEKLPTETTVAEKPGTTPTTPVVTPPSVPDDPDPDEYPTITVAEAIVICNGLESGIVTKERYYIRATVETITNAAYGAMVISDGTGSISVYGTYNADGSIGYAEMSEKPYKGDEVLLYCTLQNYNGTPEIKNARLISFKAGTSNVNPDDYADVTVAEAREATTGTKVKVDGVVARITYANGMKPSGFYLVDETQSIYVYDGDLAARLQIGNRVTILASKTYWILDDEKNNAQKFGYNGCCQLEDATLVDCDNKTDNEFNKNWISNSTVKAIVDTPVSENVTSTIYKVNALVKKVPGNGFTNYYFYDLDGETGTYTYTQCNGKDFAWLDAFDGKICTVYLSPLNAKSTSSACYFRFVPVAVIDEGFTFDLADTAKHVVEYYGVGQFLSTYSGDPAREVITKVSSSLLGFENATVSYTSSNTKVVYFETANGATVMHCKDQGTATVTVSCTYNGSSYSATVVIKVTGAQTFESITVEQAIDAEIGEIVTVKGIVGPSLVNKSGFYLIDETGIIAITVDASAFEGLQIGQEIVISGKRDCYKNPEKEKGQAGQTCITNCTILANYYGNHEYNTSFFITDKTLADLSKLDFTKDYTTNVYVVKATVALIEDAYFTSIKLTSGNTSFSLYCSSAGQYGFLKTFAGQEVTLEIAPCNWNDKDYYTGCVLAVRTDNGKVLNTLNFLQ